LFTCWWTVSDVVIPTLCTPQQFITWTVLSVPINTANQLVCLRSWSHEEESSNRYENSGLSENSDLT
jgi:hypothetical protein